MKYGHLERINITLRTLAPVFIGSGQRYTKKEYIFDPAKRMIHFVDFARFITFLKNRSLLAQYQDFLMQMRASDLRGFLNDNQVSEADYPSFVLYSIAAGEAVDSEKFREVLTFIKDISGLPFIPGSSLKGAFRTALGAYLMKKWNGDRLRKDIEQADTTVKPRRYLQRESQNLERQLFCRLDIRDHRTNRSIPNAINDFMQGIRISDSAPLSLDTLTLSGKYDRRPDGSMNNLPIFRECLQPGCEANLVMTLDLPILAKAQITAKDIELALHEFADHHYAYFEQHFVESPEDADIATQQGVDVILGGGAGYVSKTLTYHLWPHTDKSLRLVAQIMKKQFPPQHGHSRDVDGYKVSPHTLKITKFAGQFYPMGRCELIFH